MAQLTADDDTPNESGVSLEHRDAGPAQSEPFLERLLGRFRQRGRPRSRDAAGDARHVSELCHALLSERGEVSGARRAAEVLDACRSLDAAGLELFFDRLVEEFSPDSSQIQLACDAYQADPSQVNLVRLRTAAESPRQELFRRFNMTPGATAVLVDLRRQLLRTLTGHPERVGVDADLIHLFRSWFNRGFLILRRIDWRTSALVLERLIEHEAVHQVQGWRDLRRRLAADRRCYAFFHPALPDEPLIFIEIALTTGIAARVQPLLDPDAPVIDPARTDGAIFYSITNCQAGLRGVSFGNLLIKQVVEDLGREFPRLRTFATLSPIPGFVRWLASGDGPDRPRISPAVERLVAGSEREGSIDVDALADTARDEIKRLCAHYLLHARRGSEAYDPVARFHLTNGARLERLNWMGDISPSGIKRSLGLMVNYVYRLDELEKNHEAYATQHQIVASAEFRRLAAGARRDTHSLRTLSRSRPSG